MIGLWSVFRRELMGYFSTPVAYVFIVVFLLVIGVLTFYVGNFIERGQADLQPFFIFHPWLYLIVIPALAMRLWAEERKLGTIEVLLTLPINLTAIVIGKFLAAWCCIGFTLIMTFPIWLTVSYLGSPDHGVIVSSYLGSLLMAGSYLAICACLSATTKNQVIAFVMSVALCFAFTISGFPIVLDFLTQWIPGWLFETITMLNFSIRFNSFIQGVIEMQDVSFFVCMIVFWLFSNVIVVELTKAS